MSTNTHLSGLSLSRIDLLQTTHVDPNGEASTSRNQAFTTDSARTISTIVSDDFSACSLNTGLWTFVNPLNDGVQTISANRLSLSVPAGTAHDVWVGGNFAPRIMQPANNTDFEVEVKFESPLSQQYQDQGIIVESDPNTYIRYDFYTDGSETHLFAATFVEGEPTVHRDIVVLGNDVAPTYMRVTRSGNNWTQSYSTNGVAWTSTTQFPFVLTVTKVGVFVGNNSGGDPVPAATSLVDYFFNTASPISPEDAGACAFEMCNGIDDDNDGSLDEGCDDDNDDWCDAALITNGTPPACPHGGNDCDVTNGGVWRAPGVVGSFHLSRGAGGVAVLQWDSQDQGAGSGTAYDIVEGDLQDLRATGFSISSCLANNWPDTPYEDARPVPPPNTSLWFLVRASNTCGVGSYERPVLDQGSPCP